MNVTIRLKGPPVLKLRYQPGATGPAGTIEVGTVTTGAPGTSVIIANVGTPENAILNITIPRGDVGLTGDKGWSPILAIVSDGTRRVLQVADWTGGEGSKPGSGLYIGAAGLTAVLADAIDIRGPQGIPGSVSNGDKVDITVSGTGDTWTINPDAVGNTKLANMATARIKGRASAGTGDPEDLTAAQVKTVLGVTSAGDAILTAADVPAQRSALSLAAQVSAKTGAYAVVAGDYGKTFAGSGTWTFGLLPASTAGTDFWIEIRNTGTGKITIDPNAAELVNGLATLTLYRGDAVKLLCDGTGWHALFQSPFSIIEAATTGSALALIDLLLPSEFRIFTLDLDGFEPSASAALGLRLSNDGGSTFYSSTSNYAWNGSYDSASTTSSTTYKSTGGIFGSTGLDLTPGVQAAASGASMHSRIVISPRSTSRFGSVQWQTESGAGISYRGSGYLGVNTADINALRLLYSASANIASGGRYELIGQR